MRSAAGGETGAPRSPRGTRLKATTERAFLVSLALQRSAPKRLVHPCRPCGTGSPAPIQGNISGEKPAHLHRVSIARLARATPSPADADLTKRKRGQPNINLGRKALNLEEERFHD